MDGSAFNVSNAPAGSVIAKPQKAFAIAFAVLATALAGCASGLGAASVEHASISTISRVEDGTVVDAKASAETDHAYIVRLRTGELVSIIQTGKHAIKTGTPVLIQFGDTNRVIPQNSSIGYL
ncbi:MAG: hypothetical protein EOP61_26135 [Sphingomonadales bacterium]|nr:MAG: hypothetical protein EOP61_26135 [Sphingomonadales bacterium]